MKASMLTTMGLGTVLGISLLATAARPSVRAPRLGAAPESGQCAARLATFDTLDFDVFSNQKWTRLSESHANDIVVT